MKTQQKIRTSSRVSVGGAMVEVASLPPEAKKKFATEVKKRYMNAFFSGRAVFRAEGEPAR